MSVLFVCVLLLPNIYGFTQKDDIQQVTAVEGREADLPCDLRSSETSNQPILVIWFKNKIRKPVYSFDLNNYGDFGEASSANVAHLTANVPTRTSFLLHARPHAVLRLRDVKWSDSGLYRCRVDFPSTPTINRYVHLSVIVPPDRPVIYYSGADGVVRRPSSRDPLQPALVGPVDEGSSLTLTCRSHGGRPAPTHITWYLGSQQINDGLDIQHSREAVTAVMHLTSLGRHHRAMSAVCVVVNNNITAPASTAIQVVMNLHPLTVDIVGVTGDLTLTAGQGHQVVCVSHGSWPPAQITWWLDNDQVTSGRHSQVMDGGNATRSRLLFTAAFTDDGRQLICKAHTPHNNNNNNNNNNKVPQWTISSQRRLVVLYAPVIEVHLGSALQHDNVREGGDVYFECSVRANPPIYSLTWTHNGKPLKSQGPHVISAARGHDRVMLGERTLVIRNISRLSGGDYRCSATNNGGRTVSRRLGLLVKHAPYCAQRKKVVFYLVPGEEVVIKCHVIAEPAAARFHWSIKSSGHFANASAVTQPRQLSGGHNGTLVYRPVQLSDYGQLLCGAENNIGKMWHQCRFSIWLAEDPAPVTGCTVAERSSTSLVVECSAPTRPSLAAGPPPGNGSRSASMKRHPGPSSSDSHHQKQQQQEDWRFWAVVKDSSTDVLLLNVSSERPSFQLRQLPAGGEVRVLVTVEGRGRRHSRPFIIDTSALRTAEQRVHSADVKGTTRQSAVSAVFLAVVLGVVACFLAFAVGFVLLVKWKRQRRNWCVAKVTAISDQCDPDDGVTDLYLQRDLLQIDDLTGNVQPRVTRTERQSVTVGGVCMERHSLLLSSNQRYTRSTHTCSVNGGGGARDEPPLTDYPWWQLGRRKRSCEVTIAEDVWRHDRESVV